MASKKCGACGAGFTGEGAADALATHIEGFHPPTPLVEKAKAVTGGAAVDKEARAAIKTLGDALDAHGDRLAALEAAAADEGGTAEPADEPVPDGAGEAGKPPAG